MKRVQIMSIVLIIILAIGILAGCGSNNSATSTENNSNNSSTTTNDSNSSNDNAGKVKLTALINKSSLTKDVNEMQWLAELEEKCNVEIEWQQISADWDQKKGPMFASGNIPDLLFNATSDEDYVIYDGLFENLKPLIEEYAPNIQRMFKEHPEIEYLATMLSGEIYAIPSYKGGLWPDASNVAFINQVWLDNVGKEIPTTWGELKDVLIAFRDQDANGNGDKNDEVPLDFNAEMWDFSIKQLLGSLGLQLSDDQDGYFVEDATVKNYFVDERFKTVMIFLQELYNEGLINKEVVTQGYSKCQALARGDGEIAKVGVTYGWEAGDKFGNILKDQYVMLPQLKVSADATYDLRWRKDYYSLNYLPNRVAMSAQCKNKEAAMKFIDGFYDPVVGMQVLFGGMNDVDKGIKDNGDGTYTVLPPADPSLDPGSWKWANTFADNGPYYISDEIKEKLTLGTDMQAVLEERVVYQELLDKADPKKDIYPQGFMKYTKDELDIMARNQANINNITHQQWAIWMTGTNDIESEWDSYVESVYNAGLAENLEIRQRAFDEYLKSLD